MKKSDYESIIKDLNNPDKVAEAIVRLDEQLGKDETDYNNLQVSNDTLQTSVNDLRDTNAKLALRVTQHVEMKEALKQERDYFKELTDDIYEGLEGTNSGKN